MYLVFELILLPVALLCVLLIYEQFAFSLWTRHYYIFGIPVYSRTIPIELNARSENSIAWVQQNILKHYKGRLEIILSRKGELLIRQVWLIIPYIYVMRGYFRIDQAAGRAQLRGFLHYWVILACLITVTLIYIDFVSGSNSFSSIYIFGLFSVSVTALYLWQRRQFNRFAEQARVALTEMADCC